MLRHLVAIPSWYGAGAGGYFRDQAPALQAAGWKVAILAPSLWTLRDARREHRPLWQATPIIAEQDGLPIYRRKQRVVLPRMPYRNPLTWSLGGMKLFERYADESGLPHLVHAHCCLNAGVLALLINRRYAIPYIVTEQSTSFWQERLRWWERDLVRRVTRHADKLIAVSPDLARLLEKTIRSRPWIYLSNVLGDTFLPPLPMIRSRFRHGGFVFFCAARLSPEKGHQRLLEAFAQSFQGRADTRLVLAGDGPTRPELEALCVRQGIAEQVDFLGFIPPDGIRDMMDKADAFVLASDVESFSVVVIEAFARGLPVVATASGGPHHLINDVNGLLVPIRNVDALSQALLVMRASAYKYDKARIRSDALLKYGPETFAARFAEIVT